MEDNILRDNNEQNSKKYHLHIDLGMEYEPIQKRSKKKEVCITSSRDKENMRHSGLKHIDLWCNGSLYPINPQTVSHPPFSNPTTLLRFTGDGDKGLLGYCKSISTIAQSERFYFQNQAVELVHLREDCKVQRHKLEEQGRQIANLMKQINRYREKETCIGPRKRKRKLKNVEQLKVGSGGLKKRIKAIRVVLQPDKENVNPNINPAMQLKPLVTSRVAKTLIQEKKFKVVQRHIVDQFVTNTVVSALDIQGIMDSSGVSRKGYAAIQKSVSSVLGAKGIKRKLLPSTTEVWKLRGVLNSEQLEYFGTPFHIKEEYKDNSHSFMYDEFNNIFMDLELLQQRMVEFYDISYEETGGVLQFVMKMDECEILKEKKMERVTITLMNRALANLSRDDPLYFSVQSENNIWWLGSFQVLKEDHEVLSWVFHRTTIPHIISEQMKGNRTLSIDKKGEFQVVWHLAGDLKTLKCLFNCSKGANAKSPCLYCMDSANHLDSKWWRRPPNRNLLDENFLPIFNIPLVNVHICTLHGLCRIIEKLVYLHIGFAWKIKNAPERKNAITALERVLSKIGLHGGNVQIVKDMKKSSNEKDVPMKPSIGGVKARRFLSKITSNHQQQITKPNKVTYTSKIEYQQWKRLHNAVKDQEGASRNAKSEVWQTIDVLFQMCEKLKWNTQDRKHFQENLQSFQRAFKAAWTNTQITHYMHIMYNHMPFFIHKYGNPSIWNTQGLEKSHYMARNAYFRHTQHGGGRSKANSLYEMFQWFYRRILQQLRKKQTLKSSKVLQAMRVIQQMKAKRSEAFKNSNAILQQNRWREQKTYANHRWINRS